jgi:hypothetical protein
MNLPPAVYQQSVTRSAKQGDEATVYHISSQSREVQSSQVMREVHGSSQSREVQTESKAEIDTEYRVHCISTCTAHLQREGPRSGAHLQIDTAHLQYDTQHLQMQYEYSWLQLERSYVPSVCQIITTGVRSWGRVGCHM